MIQNIQDKIVDAIWAVEDPKKLAAISLIPIIGPAFGISRQFKENFGPDLETNKQIFERIERKNLIKKIFAVGTLIQTIAFIAYHRFHGVPYSVLARSQLVVWQLTYSAVMYATAKINEYRIPSPNAISIFGTTVL